MAWTPSAPSGEAAPRPVSRVISRARPSPPTARDMATSMDALHARSYARPRRPPEPDLGAFPRRVGRSSRRMSARSTPSATTHRAALAADSPPSSFRTSEATTAFTHLNWRGCDISQSARASFYPMDECRRRSEDPEPGSFSPACYGPMPLAFIVEKLTGFRVSPSALRNDAERVASPRWDALQPLRKSRWKNLVSGKRVVAPACSFAAPTKRAPRRA